MAIAAIIALAFALAVFIFAYVNLFNRNQQVFGYYGIAQSQIRTLEKELRDAEEAIKDRERKLAGWSTPTVIINKSAKRYLN